MPSLTYMEFEKLVLTEKTQPYLLDPRVTIVRMTRNNICTNDLHIKRGSSCRSRHYRGS